MHMGKILHLVPGSSPAPVTHAPLEGVMPEDVEAAAQLVRGPFERLRAASRRGGPPSYAERREWLDALLALVRENQWRIEEALDADFGGRARQETRIAELWCVVKSVQYIRGRLKGWMRARARGVPFALLPGRAHVVYQPLGVVGVIAPWNYAFQLAIEPAAYALAAGNRVLLKPSEHTSRTAALIKELVTERFSGDVMHVVTGGSEVGEAVARLPLDHLLFTGSAHVGRLVLRAAAENLVPVTLELGGKSPAIVHESFSVTRAAARIAAAKWFNAGQTCVAPDYVLVAESRRDALVEAIVAETRRSFPTLRENPDYTSIINTRHRERLEGLVSDAVARGARHVEVKRDGEVLPADARRMAPSLLLDATEDMHVMQEEIFGPVLPVVTYRTIDDAITFVNRHPRPLALYYFDDDAARRRVMLERTVSGGVTLNDAAIHFLVDDIPFGGIGSSGMGAYHGREGFELFSHRKGVFTQARFNTAGAFSPPYGERVNKLLKMLIGG